MHAHINELQGLNLESETLTLGCSKSMDRPPGLSEETDEEDSEYGVNT